MYAFLEDCPLGFENEGLMFEACLVEAEKANLALDMCNALRDIDHRKACAKRDSLSMDFNALMSFYEDDNSDGGEKKQGLVKKAWGAIASLFQSISNFFSKMSGKKVPDGSYEARAELPTFLQKSAEFLSKITEVVNLKNITALVGAAFSANNLLDWLSNVWFAKTGKKTKRFQANEIQKMLQSAQEAEAKYAELINKINANDIEQGFDKEWNDEKAKAEAEKAHLTERLKEINNGTLWGQIRSAITKFGNAIKNVGTTLWNKIFNKDSGDESEGDSEGGENNDDENSEQEKSGDDQGGDGKSDQGENNDKSDGNANSDEKNGKKSSEGNGSNGGQNGEADNNEEQNNAPKNDNSKKNASKNGKKSNNNSSGNTNNQGSKKKKGIFGKMRDALTSNKDETEDESKTEEADSTGGELFDVVMESLDEILLTGTPSNPIYEEDDDMDIDDRYNAYRDAEDDIGAGYDPGEFDGDAAFEGYDLENVEDAGAYYTEEYDDDTTFYGYNLDTVSESADEFDMAFGDYMTENNNNDTGNDPENVWFEGYDIDSAGYGQYAEEEDSDGDDGEISEDAWDAELDALCNELMEE